MGITIAFGAIISSYTVKFILPYLSEFVFRKVGYGAMVLSGFVLLVSTSQKIIQQDKVSISTIKKDDNSETTISWRKSDFTLEFAWDDGLEIERPIQVDELPKNLKEKYTSLSSSYDKIMLEKVFKVGSKSYEFYCFKNNVLTKLEFDADEELY
jgi:hypothetical protein